MLEKLNIMYDYARKEGYCTNRKTFASLLGTTESAVSRAFAGVLSSKFLLRVNEAIGGAFSPEWVLYGTGEMYAASYPVSPDTTPLPLATSSDTPTIEDRHVKNLEDLVETLQAFNKVLQKDNARLERENEALKKGSALAKNA